MLPRLIQAYASKLCCKYDWSQPALQTCWGQTWHHRARRKGRSWSLVLPFRQNISHCFWRAPSKVLTWHRSLQDGLMQTQIWTIHPTQPKSQDFSSRTGSMQFKCMGLSHQAFEKDSLVSLKQHSSHTFISGWVACLQSHNFTVQWFPLTTSACSHKVLFLWQMT